MTPSIDQTLHQFAKLLPNLNLLPILTLLPNFGGFHRTLQWVRLDNRGRLLLRIPSLVPFGTCICSYVETIFSWTCHVYGPFEFRTSIGTSILLFSWWDLLGVVLAFWISILKIFKLLPNYSHRVTYITRFEKHSKSSSGHTLSIYQNLVKYRFKSMFLKESLTCSSTVI